VGAVLCFHSVTTPALPGEGSAHVRLEDFKAYVRFARRVGQLVPLSELVRRHEAGRNTAGLVALTLDDAYAALHSELRAFLARERVPVAVFVVTDAAASGAAYWWDRIDDLFPRVRPERWRAFEEACGLPEEYRRGQPPEFGPLRPLRQWLLASCAGRWPSRLEPALAALEEETGHHTAQRSMTFAQIEELAALPEVEIGVHTVSHPVLPLLPDEELSREVSACFAALRERLRAPLPVLAIPYGLYDARTLRVARAAGMSASLTLGGCLGRRGGDDRGVPRHCVGRGDTPAKLGLRLLGVPDLVRRYAGRRTPRYPDLPSATT
jgi:peptidoglycan/xylan/chitin deacetylase (PgdA/CDA1 family)